MVRPVCYVSFFCQFKRRVAVVQPKQIDIDLYGMYIAFNKHKNINSLKES